MKLKKIAATLLLTLAGAPLFAETLLIHVNGMVCGFCAAGINDRLRKYSAVEDVKVDLGQKLVTVRTKEGEKISEEQIAEAIKSAGFELKSTERK